MPNQLPIQRLYTRRAIGFVVMSAILPGSAQTFAGNRAVGRWARRIFFAVAALVVLAGVGLLVARGFTVGVLMRPAVLTGATYALWGLFIFWVALLVDAWRLARPLGLVQGRRLALTMVTLALVVGVGGVTTLASSALTAAGNVAQVFKGGGDSEAKAGRYNILLLGADASDKREGLRPDSITVASVDAETGRTVLFGLPRNLERVRFPEGSPLRDRFPDGYVCEGNGCMLNGIYTLGEEHADLYPGQDAGRVAMKEAVSETLGLEINYYALIDMAGFESLIDAMGGIRLNIGKAIPIGGVSTKISGYIEPGENVLLDGFHALWFARSRAESSDYERMVRQKCVMAAMAKQLNPKTVATKFQELSKAGRDIVSTDVGSDAVVELTELALKARALPIETVNFTPPLIKSSDPDFGLIRDTVTETIATSERRDEPGASATPASPQASASPRASATGRPSPSATKSKADDEEDEPPVCTVP